MENIAKYFEKIIIFALSVMMMIVILLATIEFVYILISDLSTPPYIFLGINELLDIFGFFLLILIGVELFETIRTYLAEHVVHVEVVVEVALIAIARKVIILDLKEISTQMLLGISAIITSLAVAYFLIKHLRNSKAIQPPGDSQ
ncbi:MAG: phosphate-starvation-inducible PsiE family protein [Anaerolineales bacterium]|nr:phosphate-starvation-inducible PsiE family protein [Anaerolineales bacterium]